MGPQIDMVINLAALKNGEKYIIVNEVAAVVGSGAIVKAIIETGYLTRNTHGLCVHCRGAHFVKTCPDWPARSHSGRRSFIRIICHRP